jgi:uncharacterized protein (DUF2336 family)
MADPANPASERVDPVDLLASQDEPRRARVALIKRLADVVSLPSSRVNAFERSMTSDLLVEMLREASTAEKQRVAQRISVLNEPPNDLVRVLLQDEISIAELLLAEANLSDVALIACAAATTPEHRLVIARRRDVSEVVVDMLLEFSEAPVIEALLRNTTSRFSQAALERSMAISREYRKLAPLLLRREELRPAQAYVMFWWCEPDERKVILQRFAVARTVLQEAAGDVFSIAAQENWSDPLVRKALQFVERRQRNRAAQARSPYEDLEAAIAAGEAGMTRALAQEIAHLAGIKPATAAKIFTDMYGEPLAVLCKAAGAPRASLVSLWRALRRPERTSSGEMAPALERTMATFDMMAVDRAQTVLRYWNWALSSALTPALLKAIRDGDEEGMERFTLPERAAMLALGGL